MAELLSEFPQRAANSPVAKAAFNAIKQQSCFIEEYSISTGRWVAGFDYPQHKGIAIYFRGYHGAGKCQEELK